jgi:tetratricopeptide (TPR) repeat protein
MKLISRTALALALVVGSAMIGVPASAKEKGPPPLKISDAVRKPLAEEQAARQKGDTTTALAKLQEAKAAAQSADDKYAIGGETYAIGQITKDNGQLADGIDMMLQSGKVPADQQALFYVNLGKLAYMGKQYQKADTALTQAIQLNTTDADAYAILAETKNQLGQPAAAVSTIQQAATSMTAKGQPVPADWYARGISIGLTGKVPATVDLTYSWLATYPTKSNWRDALVIYRDINKVDPELDLDINRLQRAAGALKGERDYADYAEQTYLKFPGEAKAVIDEGVAAGAINLATSRGSKELQGIAAGKIAADKASLTKTATTGRGALGTADAYAAYGDYVSAISLYKQALAKGGVDADVVNLRLGAALFKSGDKEGAKQVLAQVHGTRAPVAKYWIVLIDHPVTG